MGRNPSTEYATADMALAAFLTLEGYRHTRIDVTRNGSKRPTATLVFDADSEMESAVEEYELGHGLIEPRDFMRKVAWVRNRMMDAIRDAS